jgi:O-acetylhomoserine/O-acetylserine sulfhydrylase-like pyridoxal-dependent enzyme
MLRSRFLIVVFAASRATPAQAFHRGMPTTRRLQALEAWGPDWDLQAETIALHGGWAPDPATTARAVPVYRTAPYQFRSTEEAAKLFALAELGNIYTRLQNPTSDVLEKRMALLEGGPELGGLAVASGTNAAF